MVVQLPRRVLLLLVLVTGASAGSSRGTRDPGWTATVVGPRRPAHAPSLVTTPSPESVPPGIGSTVAGGEALESTEEAASLPMLSKTPRIGGTATVIAEIGEGEDERTTQSESVTVTSKYPISGRSEKSLSSSDVTSLRLVSSSSSSKSSNSENEKAEDASANLSTAAPPLPRGRNESSYGDHSTTVSTTAVGFPRRRSRDAVDCEQFTVGDEEKREFYSPNYPDNYPSKMNCVRVLTADKGMLLKLDFRERFDLEPSDRCRFDFLEVRDGQHGYADRLGLFCGKSFPPEVTSKTRYLWLRFHSDENIEYSGFKAIWSMIPRPTYPGVPPEPETCLVNVTGWEAKISNSDVADYKKQAEKDGQPLDCMWVVIVKEGWRIQMTFTEFHLEKPNECDVNFLDVFGERTDMPSRLKNFCGSIAESVTTKTNTLYVRFYAQPKAINSSFVSMITAYREKDGTSCTDNEYDCDDSTCIDASLTCNGVPNCRFRQDEDDVSLDCEGKMGNLAVDSEHIVIILVVFSMIMSGMCFAFVFNCVRKLVRDHRIIQEHLRQSREDCTDELGRKGTPCPLSVSRTDVRGRSSESPSIEVAPSKELLTPNVIMAREYTKELVLEMNFASQEANDIHQSNNVSNATQERLQESSEEPETRDNSCQTRESLFETAPPPAPTFSTFGFRRPELSSTPSDVPSVRGGSPRWSECDPGFCPIPAPPGWSVHDPPYAVYPLATEAQEASRYRRQFPSPKHSDKSSFRSPKFSRQTTVGSGERYDSSVYGGSNGTDTNVTVSGDSRHSSAPKYAAGDPRYRAEAIIEVDQKRPFSIESTKSAPDVIATH